MAPPTTAPNPRGDWLTINPDGSLTIHDPPTSQSAARNDSRQRVGKNELFFAVPCALSQPLRLYRSFIFDSEAQAQDQVVRLNHDPQGAFPFPDDVVETMGEGAIVTEVGSLHGYVRGRIASQLDSRSDANSWIRISNGSFLLIFGDPLRITIVHARTD
jgi:hypothetical protein